MHVLILGHTDPPRTMLRALAHNLRSLGHHVDCYFDSHLDLVNAHHDFPKTDFLLLGLCLNSKNSQTNEHFVEDDVLQRAHELSIPTGIVRDHLGHLSAPYLIRHGSRVALAIVDEQPNEGCHPAELCERAIRLPLNDVAGNALIISRTITDIVRERARRRA